jgi:hypothetical protein
LNQQIESGMPGKAAGIEDEGIDASLDKGLHLSDHLVWGAKKIKLLFTARVVATLRK